MLKIILEKLKIIDLSGDFRLGLDYLIIQKTMNIEHSCPELLNNFIYGLPEIE